MEFDSTIGHEKQKRIFENIIKNGRLAHAYVLCGPEHTGKTTVALELSRLLGADPIMDLIVFDEEEGISVEEARDVQTRLSLTPVGSLKVAVISYVEKMTLEAANSLLKTLEEPPARSVLFLITANFHALLPTIVSRVQRINFGLASSQEMKEAVKRFGGASENFEKITDYASGRIGLVRGMTADSAYFDFTRECESFYEVMESGAILDKLLASEKLAVKDARDVENFLKFASRRWVSDPKGRLGQGILEAIRGLRYNLNVKLVLDNLFLN